MITKRKKANRGGAEILLVEDSLTQAEQIRHLLESHLYKVSVARDGEKAMDWLTKHKPALVISDIVMPEMNGYELCKKIKFNKSTTDIPVILLTRLTDTEEIIEGLSCGADSFITKPYNEKHLISNIENFLSEGKREYQKKVPFGVQILFKGKKRFIQAEQQNVIKLMLDIYEGAIHQNERLVQIQEGLRLLNERLESLVEDRTSDLTEEIKLSNQITKRLKESEEKWRTLVTTIPEYIGLVDCEGKFLFLNHYAEGFSEKDTIGKSHLDFIPNEWKEFYRQKFEKCISTQKNQIFEYTAFGDNKTLRTYETCLVPFIQQGKVSNIIAIARDITERKRMQDTLGKSEERFRIAAGSVSDCVWEWDILTGVLEWFGDIEKILGYGKGEFPHTLNAWEKVIHPDDHDRVMAAINQHLLAKKPYSEEYRVIKRDSSIAFWIDKGTARWDKNDKAYVMIGAVTDITSRKQAEDKLRNSEERLKILFDYAPDAYYLNDLKGNFIDGNIAAEKLLGHDKNELIGKNFLKLNLLSLKQLPRAAKLLVKNSLGYATGPDEFVLNRKDGSKVIAEIITHPVKIKDKTLVLGIARDISERKKAEEVLRESESSLRNAQEIAKMGSWEWDMVTQKTKWSENYFAIHEFNSDEVEPSFELFRNRIHPDDVHLLDETHANIIKDKTPSSFESRLIQPDGTVKWIQNIISPVIENDKLVKLKGVIVDITERKLTEEALKQSELRFKQISEYSGEWIWEVDKNCLFTYSSPVVKEILGYEPEEIINKKYFYDFFDPEAREELKQAALDAFARKESFGNFINKNFHKDGGEVILSTNGIPVLDSAGNLTGYRGVDTDITEQKNAEEAINQERRMLRTIIDHIPDTIYVKDTECRKILANIADVNYIGFEKESDVLGKTDIELYPGQTGLRGYTGDKEVISSGKGIFENEEDFINQKGKKIWLLTSKIPLYDKDGNITGLVGVGHDITERKIAEEALKHSLAFSESLLKTIPFGMHIVDEEGNVLFQSEIFKRLFGEEAIGKKCWDLYYDDKTQNSDCPLIRGITIGESDTYESHGVLGNRIFEIIYTGMMYQGKKAMLEIFQDITDRKLAEEELIKAKEKAESSDRLKTAFLHNISHEIRTPMNAIVGFSTLLGEPDVDIQTRQSYIEVIMQSSNHLLSIITDIVDISNIEANLVKTIKSEISVNSTLKSLCNQFMPQANEKKIQLVCETLLSDSDAFVLTDSTKLTQILSNLISNALKFTDKGNIKVGIKLKDSFLEFSVSDTGIGIPEEYHKRIFDRFYQVQNTVSRLYEGTGLGLSISKAYVELLGGKIWVSSETGKGTSFFFTIPYEKQVVETVTVKETRSPKGFVFPEKRKILVAEDIDSNFKLIQYFLSGTNTDILRAVNGKEAVEKCLSAGNIDLVLMDIKMPVMDGYTAARLIRETNSAIPIIAQTAYADDRETAIECGCSGFISKPFDKKGLLKVISEFI